MVAADASPLCAKLEPRYSPGVARDGLLPERNERRGGAQDRTRKGKAVQRSQLDGRFGPPGDRGIAMRRLLLKQTMTRATKQTTDAVGSAGAFWGGSGTFAAWALAPHKPRQDD